jgi:hypothetical protein
MNQRISANQKLAKADAGPSLVASRLVLEMVLDASFSSVVLCAKTRSCFCSQSIFPVS